MSVRELHNNIVSTTKYCGLEEAIDEDDNIIISDYTLCSLLPPHFKKFHQDIRSCVVANVAYLPRVCIHHYFHGVIVIKKTQGPQPKCSKQKFWGKSKFIYMKLIKNTVMPHGRHIYPKAYDMEKATMCANSQSDNALPH